MRVFGGIIPFFGWRTINVDSNGMPCNESTDWKADALEAEWFSIGVVLFVGKIYQESTKDTK